MGAKDFQTLDWVAQYMVTLVPDGVGVVLEPTSGAGNLVRALCCGGYVVDAPDSFWDIDGWWDCIVMNPPFSPMRVGYEMLSRCMEMSDIIIALMPWFFLINSERRAKDIWNFGLRSVTHLPRAAFPGSRVQCCVLELERGHRGVTQLHFLSREVKGRG